MTARRVQLLKVVSGLDIGGVRSAELGFTAELQARGVGVGGVIVTGGAMAARYARLFDGHWLLDTRLPEFRGGRWERLRRTVVNLGRSRQGARRLAGDLRGTRWASAGTVVAVRHAPLLPLAALLARRLDLPLLWHMPNPVHDRLGRAYFQALLRLAGGTAVGNSRYTLASLGAGDGPVIYPGFSPARVALDETAPELRASLGIPAAAPVFAVVARLTPDKATDWVLAAFLDSAAFRNGAHLLIAGGPLDSRFALDLRAHAGEAGDGRVHFLGEVEQVAPVYRAADVLVAGRRTVEPFGISLVEAMASGLPVIAPGGGGPDEVVTDGVTGWLLPDRGVAAYTRALDRAWSDRARWPVMGGQARTAAAPFSLAHQAGRYLQLVRAVLDPDGDDPAPMVRAR
ncbi:glycosyltransferase family 4 protein [Alkalilimnicola ehrlichii MLHE-1]|uniref:Glycosyl transferase, group 1 n=1 Tax=Alkalilimnicola ehrlichii (strain ATCC BAA-1101 / DSM 17681 / MLHE-1) TaxID=187272 RepID=Q0A632_ALKEH|nr:glycosyltransferase family 4 protein [Alkalilimnicola ehrlichii]ABI57705.1 glycosyl transferase, group 1 [Alkalilimnicola ehrlichii MLHE-1]